jgi:anti-sigma factor RsiW
MNQDFHDRAKELVMATRTGALSGRDERWLQSHLGSCAGCAAYAEQIESVVGALRTVSVMPSAGLVHTTQLRVRVRARELQARQAALRPLWIACAVAVLCSLVTTAYLWMGFAWLGRNLRIPDPIWQLGFVLSWAVPGLIGAALLIAAHTHSARQEETEIRIRG